MSKKKQQCFIVLHIGAGFHCPSKHIEYKKLCTKACNIGMKLLQANKTCVEVVDRVCSLLEDSPLTNAGYGSNLSMNGLVECDAGIMESSLSAFGAVSCLKSVKNPIKLARVLLEEQIKTSNLVPPIVLSGEGACKKAISSGLKLVTNKDLTSPQAINDHRRYKRILKCSESKKRKRVKLENDEQSKIASEGSDSTDDNQLNKVLFEAETSTECKALIHQVVLTTENDNNNVEEQNECCDEISINNGTSERTENRCIDEHCYTKSIGSQSNVYNLPINNEVENDDQASTASNNGHSYCQNVKFSDPISAAYEDSTDYTLPDSTTMDLPSKLYDTIGVICIDNNLDIASGVSSGGIVLKQQGRVGHASHFGCGCWAFRYAEDFSIGCCTSGCGELLIRTGLAKRAAEFSLEKTHKVLNYNKFIEEKFLNSPYIENCHGQKLCGLLLVKLFKDKDNPENNIVDLQLAHTSESFGVAFLSSDMSKPRFIMSRLQKEMSGSKVVTQGFEIQL